MENKRPTLNDPTEFALIKSVYFKNDRLLNESIDPIEELERMESKLRNQNKSSR
jgi:hypothetical protein